MRFNLDTEDNDEAEKGRGINKIFKRVFSTKKKWENLNFEDIDYFSLLCV